MSKYPDFSTEVTLPLYTIATLTQIPNLSAQYNFDTFLVQFQTQIREREFSDRKTLISCIIALVMAFIFYCVINVTATNMVDNHMIEGEPHILNKLTVCESMLLWPDPIIAISLATIFFLIALVNIVFTSFIAYEQITMFY